MEEAFITFNEAGNYSFKLKETPETKTVVTVGKNDNETVNPIWKKAQNKDISSK